MAECRVATDVVMIIMKFLSDCHLNCLKMSRVSWDWYRAACQLDQLTIDLSSKLQSTKKLTNFLSSPFLYQIKFLNLSKNQISTTDMIKIAKCDKFTQLQVLILCENEFSIKSARAFAKSSFLLQLEYIDLRRVVMKDNNLNVLNKFIGEQTIEMQPFWQLVLGNCGRWLYKLARLGAKGGNSLQIETQLELSIYCFDNQLSDEGYQWLNMASTNNHPEALFLVGRLLDKYGEDILNDVSPYYPPSRSVFQYYYESSIRDYEIAYYFLAQCYEIGKGIDKNLDEALKWYLRAVDVPNLPGLDAHKVGNFIETMDSSKIEQANKWYKLAEQKGYVNGETIEIINVIESENQPISKRSCSLM